ncbi:MAG TPA: hypothetical protein VFL80_02050 [Thermoanaerobaculia bacterium]|nr:hypothetical protein [Thermoanaerobaculia bacterium]
MRVAEDGRIHLRSRLPKGWKGRTVRTPTNPEVPGTAILCEEQWYEVLEAHERAHGSEYVLAPWSDAHAMRTTERYDDAREAERAAAHRRAIQRERGRFIASLGGVFTGHLPAVVQEELGSELGVSPQRLTLVSVVPQFVIFGIAVHLYLNTRLASAAPLPFAVWLLVFYLVVDGLIRFQMAYVQNRPCGSVFGLIAYLIYWGLSPRRRELISPFAEEKGMRLFFAPRDPEVAKRDSYRMREPFFTLLSPAEQERLATLHGFDYRAHASQVAAVILFFALCGLVTSIASFTVEVRLSAILSLIAALYLAVEQIRRLLTFSRRPAGSVLGVVIRPLARRFLN